MNALSYTMNPSETLQSTFGNDVFIVHGRDDEAKVTVARFVEHLGIEAIILDEAGKRRSNNS